MNIAIINGPNLNLLGIREPEIYGKSTFESFFSALKEKYPGQQIVYFQSNVEGELINYIHQCYKDGIEAILLNAGAYTHTSIAIADAVSAVPVPVIEIHISNVLGREDFRKTSYVAATCVGSISGLGLKGYELGIDFFIQTNRTNA